MDGKREDPYTHFFGAMDSDKSAEVLLRERNVAADGWRNEKIRAEKAEAERDTALALIAQARLVDSRAYHSSSPTMCGNHVYGRESLNHSPECNAYHEGVTDTIESLITNSKSLGA